VEEGREGKLVALGFEWEGCLIIADGVTGWVREGSYR
jgi:hypothetical protein